MSHTAQAVSVSILTLEFQSIPEGFSAAVENDGNVLSCDMDMCTTWDSPGMKVHGGSGMRISRWKLEGMKYPAILGL